INMGWETDETIAESVGMTGQEIKDMYRLLAIAKYDERYVIPPAHYEDAHKLENIATECSLNVDGGPGMGGMDGSFGDEPGLGADPAVGSPVGPGRPAGVRINLVDWDGQGTPDGLFPGSHKTP
ncbi:MAG: nitrate reductase subunit beta, partial [Mycobacteriaceae bacterium]